MTSGVSARCTLRVARETGFGAARGYWVGRSAAAHPQAAPRRPWKALELPPCGWVMEMGWAGTDEVSHEPA
jgi:hypothetical protein